MLKHRILFGEAAIQARVGALAETIGRDLPTPTPLLIGLLTGSFVFLADLMRAVARHGVEPQIDFIAISHYGLHTESPGAAQIRMDTALDVSGQAVLLVDDILDSGRSLRLARDHLAGKGAAWLRTCVFLDKQARRAVEIEADYVGFEVPDAWIIGYGLDAGGQGRALPYVAAIESQRTSVERPRRGISA